MFRTRRSARRNRSWVQLVALLGFVFMAECGGNPALAAKPQKWAVLIGIDDFAHLKDLAYCVADQQELHNQLIASGFEKERVFLLRDKAEDVRLLPFQRNIERQLKLVLGLAEKGDLVLVAFSGHGMQVGRTPYLCPADARIDEPDTLISLDWLYEELQDCAATLKLVMVDACRNDPSLDGQRAVGPHLAVCPNRQAVVAIWDFALSVKTKKSRRLPRTGANQ